MGRLFAFRPRIARRLSVARGGYLDGNKKGGHVAAFLLIAVQAQIPVMPRML